jgi:hypothetical protein
MSWRVLGDSGARDGRVVWRPSIPGVNRRRCFFGQLQGQPKTLDLTRHHHQPLKARVVSPAPWCTEPTIHVALCAGAWPHGQLFFALVGKLINFPMSASVSEPWCSIGSARCAHQS